MSALSSGCALRPVLRGELNSYTLEQPAFALGAELGAPAEAPVLLATSTPSSRESVIPAPAPAPAASKAEPAAPEPRLAQAPPPATAPVVNRVAVAVRAKDTGRHVEVVAPSGQRCTMPCALDLAPGPNLLSFEGDAKTAVWVDVPPRGGTLEVKLGSAGGRVVAWVLGGTGTLLIAVGAALIPVLGGIPLLIMAGVGLALLIPGIIVGASSGDSVAWVPEPAR